MTELESLWQDKHGLLVAARGYHEADARTLAVGEIGPEPLGDVERADADLDLAPDAVRAVVELLDPLCDELKIELARFLIDRGEDITKPLQGTPLKTKEGTLCYLALSGDLMRG